MSAASTGSPRGSGWISKRFLVVLLFLGAVNLAGLAWLRELLIPARSSLRVASAEITSEADGPPTIRVLFSREVLPAEQIAQIDPAEWLRITPDVPGSARWSSPKELIFEPSAPLPFSRDLTVAIAPPPRLGGPVFEGPLKHFVRTPALKLLNVTQLNFSSDREARQKSADEGQATLRLAFNGPVEPRQLVSHLLVFPGRDSGGKDDAVAYEILTEKPSSEVDIRVRSPSAKIVVALGPAIEGREDMLRLQSERSVEIELTHALRLTEARGSRATLGAPSLELYFNNTIVADESVPVERQIQIVPDLPFTVTTQWSKIILYGAFESGGHYRVTVQKGLKGVSGSLLAADAIREVYFPDREPSLSFSGQGTFLSSQGNLSLLIKCVNVRTVSVQASRVHANNLVHALELGGPRSNFVRTLPSKIYHVPAGLNQVRDVVVDLHDLVGEDPRGVWWIRAGSGPGETDRAGAVEQIVSVSDIGITVKEGANKGHVVWALSLETGEPLAGVTIGLRSLSNQLISEGVTGVDGLAFFEDLPLNDGPPHLVVATNDRDLAYLELAQRRLPRSDFDVGGRPYLSSGYEAFLFADRGVYRPGETVHLRGLVRGAGGSVPAPFPLEIETLRPDGKRYRLEKAALDREGAFDAVIAITVSAHTGLYQIDVRLPGGTESPGPSLGSETFRVEEYMPSRLRVEVSAEERVGVAQGEDPRRHKPGEVVEIHVRGSHLFGLPAADCSVDATWSFVPSTFAPREWRGFQFGELKGPKASPRVEARSLVLDSAGEAIVKVQVPELESTLPLALRFTARVTDLGGRPVAGSVNVPIDPAVHYLGLRALASKDDTGIQTGKAARFECVALKPDGSPSAIEAADLLVQAYEWATVLKRDSSGEYRYESREEIREVARQRVAFSGGRGAFEHTFSEWGAYRLRLKDPASLAAAELYVFAGGPGVGFTPASLERPERLDITFARSAYRPGETARVRVKAPFAGTLLLTLEGDKVHWAHVMKTEGPYAEADLPLPADATAAFYVGASIVRGVDPNARWLPHRAFGIEPIPLDLTSRRLTVTLSAPGEAKPEELCTLRASVSRDDGEPVPGAEVLIALVDEGILSLTSEELPDPYGYFYGRRAHAVETSDMFGSLLEEVPLARERSRPGGDGSGSDATARRLNPVSIRRVTPAVIWHGPLVTGEDGSAFAQLRLPKLTGELRITLVASAKGAFGSSRRSLLVRRPFFFESSFPRFLAPGDVFQVPVSIFNRTPSNGAAAMVWSLDNLLEGGEPPAADLTFAIVRDSKLDVPAWGAARASYRMRAGDSIGKASAKLEASLGGESHSETIELPVRPPAPLLTDSRSGEVTAEAPLEIAPAQRLLKGTSRWRLVLSDFPDLDLAGSLEYLLDYPYGCLEQTTSSAFALLYLRDLAEKAGLVGYGVAAPGASRLGAVQSYIEGGLARILDMQSQGGWMGMYPHASSPAPWCTVYATHFLLEAKTQGYAVPEEELGAALRYIDEAIVEAPATIASGQIVQASYGAYVLALAQKPNRRAMSRLRDLANGAAPRSVDARGKPIAFLFPPSARSFLSVAYLITGDRSTAAALQAGPLPASSLDVESGGAFQSPAREDAILLGALVDLDPADSRIPELIGRLKRRRVDGRWSTTQENAFALLALGKLARRQILNPEEHRAEVTFAAQPPAQLGPGESRVFQGAELEGSIKVEVSGPGRLYFWWTEEGVPLDGKIPEIDSGLVVRRELLDRGLNPLDPLSIRVGEDILVRWSIEAREPVENVAVVDLLPAGIEVENPVLGGALLDIARDSILGAESVSLRDDRVIAFFNLSNRTKGEYYYAARAVTRGEFRLPPLSAEAMYRPGTRSISGAGKVVIK